MRSPGRLLTPLARKIARSPETMIVPSPPELMAWVACPRPGSVATAAMRAAALLGPVGATGLGRGEGAQPQRDHQQEGCGDAQRLAEPGQGVLARSRTREHGRQLASPGHLGEDAGPHRRRSRSRHGSAEACGGGGQLGDLLAARGALLEVVVEGVPLVVGQGIGGVGAGQGVDVVFGHASTPMQSRSRMSPSRRRVLTVPSGTSSSSPTSR